MLVFGQIEPMGMGNLIPLPKKTAKGLEGAVYNQYAERMYRLLPHRSMPNPVPLVNFQAPIRFVYPYIDPDNEELRFTVITETGQFLSFDGTRQYLRYFNPTTNSVENRETFEQGYVVDHTILPQFVVNNPATTPTVIATFNLPEGSGTKKVVGAGALGNGSTATIFPLLQHKPVVKNAEEGNLDTAEVILFEDFTTPIVAKPPYDFIICYYVETPKERILLPATLKRVGFTRQRSFIAIFRSTMPAEVRNNISGVAVIILWADQVKIVDFIPATADRTWIVNFSPQLLANKPSFNFHTANIPYNFRAIKTVGNRTFYFYPNEIRISAIGRMWDIPDDLAPIGTVGGGAIVDVPNALDVLPFGSQFLLFTKQGVYRLFEPIEGEWTAVLLPYPPPRLVDPSAVFPTLVETTPNGVAYYGGMWFEISGTNEAINIINLPFTLLPLLKIKGSEPSIAVDKEGKVYLISDQAFYEIETEGGKDVVAFNGRYFYAKNTFLYEIDPFALV